LNKNGNEDTSLITDDLQTQDEERRKAILKEDEARGDVALIEAYEAGCLTCGIAAMPDDGRSFLGEKTWRKIQNFTAMRDELPRPGKKPKY